MLYYLLHACISYSFSIDHFSYVNFIAALHVFPTSEGNVHTEAGKAVTLQHVLIFCTGADREPPLGFPKQALLEFNNDVLATASTCDLIFCVTTRYHDNYTKFKEMMVESLISGVEFGYARLCLFSLCY